MKKILPYKYPEITSWTWTAGNFAILGNYSNATAWLYSNFAQLFCERYDKWVSVHYIPHLDVFSNNPFFQSSLLSRELIFELNIDIISFVKKCIELNYYIYCKVDEGGMRGKNRFLHELMVFGYDDASETLQIADFTFSNSQKYMFSSTTYEKFRKAYESVMLEEDDMQDGIGGDGGILIFKVNDEYEYEFNQQLLITSLKDYLNGTDSGSNYRTYDLNKASSFSKGLRDVCYGINIYKEIMRYYKEVATGSNKFYIQPLHVLYDHKVLMVDRIKYLREQKNIDISKSVTEDFLKLMKKVEIIRNMGVKYWINKDTKILEKIVKNLDAIMEEDKKVTKRFLFELQK